MNNKKAQDLTSVKRLLLLPGFSPAVWLAEQTSTADLFASWLLSDQSPELLKLKPEP